MALKRPIYLDNHATTRVDPRVFEAMAPYFCEIYGNAASRSHLFGWEAEEAIERAREQVAKLIGATPKEIVWTSGATEATNLALKGACEALAAKGNHLVTQKTEHKATLDTCARLERQGFSVTYLDVAPDGRVDPDAVARAIGDRTIIVSIMLANNEVGTIQPVADIGAICRSLGVLFHCDAVQGAGRAPFDVERDRIDLVSLSAHKIYGPKGVGALYVRRRAPRVSLVAQMDGGGHERGMRSGTLNVPGIVGFGKAAELLVEEGPSENARIAKLRDRLESGLLAAIDEVTVNGSRVHRLPGSANLSFAYIEGESLMMALRDVAVSSGSACTSASLEPSYVLRALGVPAARAHSSIRFGVGRFNTEEEIEQVLAEVPGKVRGLRELSPLYEMARSGVNPDAIAWPKG